MTAPAPAQRPRAPASSVLLAALVPEGGRLATIDLDAPLPDSFEAGWLSADETARAARFVTESLRTRYRHAHLFMRAQLAAFTGQAPADLQFEHNAWGKPHLRPQGSAAGAVEFSLSHSEHLALLAIRTGQPIGADIELIRPLAIAEMRSMARNIMTPSEQRAFDDLIDHGADTSAGKTTITTAFLTAWTRKEACVKALGLGLSYPVEQLDTGLQPAPAHFVMRAHAAGQHDTAISLQTCLLGTTAVVSVACVL